MPKLRSTYDGRLIYKTSYDYYEIKVLKILQSTTSCLKIISNEMKTEKLLLFLLLFLA